MPDTNVVIHILAGDAVISARAATLPRPALLAAISRAELEGGVGRQTAPGAALARAKLDALLAIMPVIAFDDTAAERYRGIVAVRGYSRAKLLDRMIAATAIAAGARIATMHVKDFRDIPGLEIDDWSSGAADQRAG